MDKSGASSASRQPAAFVTVMLFVVCLLPVAWYAGDLLMHGVQGVFERYADPIKTIEHQSGIWALRFLILTLAMTPLRLLTGSLWPIRYRRMLGLFAFFYACLHFLVYLFLDLEFDLADVTEDILERPYITIGLTALLLMLPLAVTSTRGWMRRLGRRWKRLHRLAYVAAVLAVMHFWWLVKLDISEPLAYALILAVLFGIRLVARQRQVARYMRRVSSPDGAKRNPG